MWPEGERNTVGRGRSPEGLRPRRSAGLRLTLNPPANGLWPDFHIHHHANLALAKAIATARACGCGLNPPAT